MGLGVSRLQNRGINDQDVNMEAADPFRSLRHRGFAQRVGKRTTRSTKNDWEGTKAEPLPDILQIGQCGSEFEGSHGTALKSPTAAYINGGPRPRRAWATWGNAQN